MFAHYNVEKLPNVHYYSAAAEGILVEIQVIKISRSPVGT